MPLFPALTLALAPTDGAQVPPPPVVRAVPLVNPAERRLLAWMPSEARCGGVVVAPTVLRRPYLALAFSSSDPTATVTYRFRLDGAGRPLSIEREGERYAAFAEDIAPSLAASRFAPGAERRDCTIGYTARLTSYAATPLGDLVSYTLNPSQGQLPREGWAAIYPAAATCKDEPRPSPLVQVFPDFEKLAGTPGVRGWTMLAYDLDAKGAPVRVGVLTSTGDRALDTAAAQALARSRYSGGARTGCRFPYWKAAATLPAPPPPETATLRPAGATCPASVTWAGEPTLRYPDNYRRRAVEGWAVIGFDLAPWGATGNARVLASEPAAEFGQAALQVIRGATVAKSAAGAVGCVERVRFVMGKPGQPATAEPPPLMVD